jgi:hypothetical protein
LSSPPHTVCNAVDRPSLVGPCCSQPWGCQFFHTRCTRGRFVGRRLPRLFWPPQPSRPVEWQNPRQAHRRTVCTGADRPLRVEPCYTQTEGCLFRRRCRLACLLADGPSGSSRAATATAQQRIAASRWRCGSATPREARAAAVLFLRSQTSYVLATSISREAFCT